jgi:hypothetical protein
MHLTQQDFYVNLNRSIFTGLLFAVHCSKSLTKYTYQTSSFKQLEIMINPIKTEDPRIISFNALRKAIGWLGILLPAAMLVGNFLFAQCYFIQDSNSHYYYTITGNLFVGILCSVALFLISYKGYAGDKTDNIVSTLAGLFALGIAFFPTTDDSTNSCAIFHLPDSNPRSITHYVCAALFFITLAYISYFLFTKSKGIKTERKKIRNKVYKFCGILIVFFIFLIAVYGIFEKHLTGISKIKPVFWLEWFALIAFGASWLIKGELLLKDKPSITSVETN